MRKNRLSTGSTRLFPRVCCHPLPKARLTVLTRDGGTLRIVGEAREPASARRPRAPPADDIFGHPTRIGGPRPRRLAPGFSVYSSRFEAPWDKRLLSSIVRFNNAFC